MAETKTGYVRIDWDVLRKFKSLCALEGKSMKDYATELILVELKKKGVANYGQNPN